MHRPLVVSLTIVFFLAACSPQLTRSNSSSATPSVQPALSRPTPSVGTDPLKLVASSYHTVLMLERADDLLLAAITKINTREIYVNDPASINPYTNAFSIALDNYNKTMPPPGALNHGWQMVSQVTQQFGIVDTALIQGKVISNNDLATLRQMRQLVQNYQDNAEGFLTVHGKGPDFFSNEKQAVEAHFRQAYGGLPLP